MDTVVGIDIGGTKCAVIIGQINKSGHPLVLDKTVLQTKDYPDPYQMINCLQQEMEHLIVSHQMDVKTILSIGISCGGPLDSVQGVILSPPNLPGWDRVSIVKLFVQKYGIPTFIQNDANACAPAEWKFGAGRGTRNMIFLTFGTGLGAGLILDGKLYAGTNDNAGEVGHIRLERFGPVGYGKSGSFEGFCSGNGIAQIAQMKALEKFQRGESVTFCKNREELEAITSKTVAEAALSGDKQALEIYKICGTYLGRGLSILIDILNPERIVIGSIFARSGDLMLPSMLKTLKQEALSSSRNVCQVVPAELGEEIGDYASLSVAAISL